MQPMVTERAPLRIGIPGFAGLAAVPASVDRPAQCMGIRATAGVLASYLGHATP